MDLQHLRWGIYRQTRKERFLGWIFVIYDSDPQLKSSPLSCVLDAPSTVVPLEVALEARVCVRRYTRVEGDGHWRGSDAEDEGEGDERSYEIHPHLYDLKERRVGKRTDKRVGLYTQAKRVACAAVQDLPRFSNRGTFHVQSHARSLSLCE